jgi:transposase, IS5 family
VINLYNKKFASKETRHPNNGRILIGAIIIKHIFNLLHIEDNSQIQENMFMKFSLGYKRFTSETLFDASLFENIQERLNLSIKTAISELAMAHHVDEIKK